MRRNRSPGGSRPPEPPNQRLKSSIAEWESVVAVLRVAVRPAIRRREAVADAAEVRVEADRPGAAIDTDEHARIGRPSPREAHATSSETLAHDAGADYCREEKGP